MYKQQDRKNMTRQRNAIALIFLLVFTVAGLFIETPSTWAANQPNDTATSADENAILFRPAFEVGRVTVYEFTASVISQQAIEDLKMSNKTETHLVMRLEVKSIDEKAQTATIAVSYDRLALTGDNSFAGISYDYDSERDPKENKDFQVAALLNRLKTSQLTATVGLDGKVKSITGNEGALAAIMRNKSLQGRAGEFNQDGLKQVLEGFWRVGEDDTPRHIGDSWTESQDMPMPSVGTLTFSTKFDLENANEKNAQLGVILDVTLQLEKDQPKPEENDADDNKTDKTIKGEDDPDNLVLNPDAKRKAEEKAFQESLPDAEKATLDVVKQPGSLTWDRKRHELIQRDTFLNFTLEIQQFEIFSQKMQTSNSLYDVVSTWKRIATE